MVIPNISRANKAAVGGGGGKGLHQKHKVYLKDGNGCHLTNVYGGTNCGQTGVITLCHSTSKENQLCNKK